MSAITARHLRRERLRRLVEAEPDLSHRALGERLGVSKDTVRRDLEAMAHDGARHAAPPAPQVTEGGAAGGAPALQIVDGGAAEPAPGGATGGAPAPGDAAPHGAPVAQAVEGGAPEAAPDDAAAPLPRRTTGGRLVLDLVDRPGLRRDLALLAQTGCTAEELVTTAVRVLATGYRQALAAGDVRAGQPFAVTGMSLGPLPLPTPRVPGPPTERSASAS